MKLPSILFFLTIAAASAALWDDPRFSKQFQGSYGIESRIEPELDDTMRETLAEIEPLIRDRKKDAIARLVTLATPEGNARYDFLLGNLYLEANDPDKARASYLAAIKKFPAYRQAYKNLGLVLAQQQDFVHATRAFTRVIEQGDTDGTTYGLLGRCLLANGDSVSAESAFRMAVMLQPDLSDWRRGLLATLIKQKRTADAVSLLDEMIAREPREPELHHHKAQVYLASGDFARAAAAMEVVARAGWAKPEELQTLGDLYMKQNLPDLALTGYKRAVEADASQDIARSVHNAEVLSSAKALDQAQALLGTIRTTFASRLTPQDKARIAKVDARISLAQRADEQAATLLREVVDADPLDGEAWMLLGKYHAEKKEEERAIFAYERAASLEKFKPDAQVKIAQLYVGQSKYTEALALLKEAQQAKPREAVAQYLSQVEKISLAKSGTR